jgi:hypothetical protein
LLHCDLSTRNLLLFDDVEYRVKLCDFGASLFNDHHCGLGGFYESHYTLPPRGRKHHDVPLIARELFAIGMAIYELTEWKNVI